MSKWEYKQIEKQMNQDREFLMELNNAGKEGWKLVSNHFISGTPCLWSALMEREIPKPAAPAKHGKKANLDKNTNLEFGKMKGM